MHLPRNRFTVLTAAAAVIMVATACTGGDDGNDKAALPASAAPATSAPSGSAVTTQPAESAAPSPTTTPSAAPPAEFGRLRTKLKYRSGPSLASHNLGSGGLIAVDSYIQDILVSVHDVWQPVLADARLTMPNLRYDAVSGNDGFVTACGDKTIRRNYGSLLYCAQDSPPDGYIALPTDVLREIWKKTDRPTGDLTVAISVSRQVSLILTSSLTRQLNLTKPEAFNPQYLSACLAGVWAHAIYPQSLDEGNLLIALFTSFKIRSEIDGHNLFINYERAKLAWMTGFSGGDPAACGQFWK